MDAEVSILAFARNNSSNPDAFVVINMDDVAKELNISIFGSTHKNFEVFRSTDDEKELFQSIGNKTLQSGKITYQVPAKSVTTFIGN